MRNIQLKLYRMNLLWYHLKVIRSFSRRNRMRRNIPFLLTFMAIILTLGLVLSCATTPPDQRTVQTAEQPAAPAPAPEPAEPAPEPQPAPEPVEPAEAAPAEAVPAEQTKEPARDFHLYLLHTNDTHGRILEGAYDGMGFAKVATAVNMYKEQAGNVLVLDAGDAMHGTTLANLVEGSSVAEVMNAVGYDAMAAGNHDFNYGYQRLIELNNETDFPILSANTYDAAGKRILPAYKIFEQEGVKIGVFGLSTPENYYKVHPKYIQGLTFEDPVVTSKEMVAELSGQVDIIIALAHLGLDEASTDTSERVAREVQGIDVIIDGHSHTTLPEGLMIGDTLIAQAGSYDQNIGVVDLHIVEKQLVSKQAYLHTKEEAAERGIEDDPQVLEIVARWQDEIEKITSEVVAYTDHVLDGEREQVRTRPTNLSRLITQSMIKATGADGAFTNGGGIRSSIDEGEITLGEIISVLPFNNTCVVIEVTGEELIAAVEHGFKDLPEPSGAYAQLGSITPIWNVDLEPGSRVYKLRIGTETVDPNKTYKIATNDFTAAGGDGYSMFADKPLLAEVGTLDEVFAEYLRENYPLP
jgi:5'-nucleotidase